MYLRVTYFKVALFFIKHIKNAEIGMIFEEINIIWYNILKVLYFKDRNYFFYLKMSTLKKLQGNW